MPQRRSRSTQTTLQLKARLSSPPGTGISRPSSVPTEKVSMDETRIPDMLRLEEVAQQTWDSLESTLIGARKSTRAGPLR